MFILFNLLVLLIVLVFFIVFVRKFILCICLGRLWFIRNNYNNGLCIYFISSLLSFVDFDMIVFVCCVWNVVLGKIIYYFDLFFWFDL